MPCHALPCHAMPCRALPYRTVLYERRLSFVCPCFRGVRNMLRQAGRKAAKAVSVVSNERFERHRALGIRRAVAAEEERAPKSRARRVGGGGMGGGGVYGVVNHGTTISALFFCDGSGSTAVCTALFCSFFVFFCFLTCKPKPGPFAPACSFPGFPCCRLARWQRRW